MPANLPHRIDKAQNAVPASMGQIRSRGRKTATVSVGVEIAGREIAGREIAGREIADQQPPDRFPEREKPTDSEIEQGPEAWLRAHAGDLVGHLQAWSIDLDQREANLNARIALHERRERQFRIQRSELSQQLAHGQAKVDQLRRQLESRTRRLAFEQHG
ncbi:hypothetical protein LF1_17660 [Rubripirellula obstinata]|uniref:Uncharacterized protein n=1 Tax=Rubripirellula obstinata TaxID=406547 RepID=A0A5B1CDL9_9BACT|nr:hypothetical protein [Rubripirellula obstinata]KAA1259237.1 hypothetical protein LF1_17660 [Rubripirellula obstinata]